jgi:hypothetical protein
MGITNFQGLISNEIVYQLCRHLERYFIVYCTEADVWEHRFPKFNIDFLIQGIENNNLSLSHNYGPIFAAKRIPPQVNTPQAGGGGGSGGGGTRGGDGGATAAAKAAQPVVRTGPGCAAITKLVEDHRAKHDVKFPVYLISGQATILRPPRTCALNSARNQAIVSCGDSIAAAKENAATHTKIISAHLNRNEA